MPHVPGYDFSGTVHAVGKNVEGFKEGARRETFISSFHSRRTRGVKSSGWAGGKANFLQGF